MPYILRTVFLDISVKRWYNYYMKEVKKNARILKLDYDCPEKELAFELDYQLSLTVQERFEMMFRKSREIALILLNNGHRKPFEIIKRK